MRRIVVDPGVLVSAIIAPAGTPADLVRAIRDDRLRLVACPHLLAELLGVLRRDKFRPYLSLDEAEQYVAGLASIAQLEPDPPPQEPLTRDPNDDYLLALAHRSSADAVVSGDADLLEAASPGMPVHPPAIALRQIRDRPDTA